LVGWDKFNIELDYQSNAPYGGVKEFFMPAYKTGVRGRPKKTFAYMVKSRRITRGYSQKQLAELLDIDHTYVSHWENGRRYPNVAILHDLVETLEYNDKEVRWLLKTLAEGKL
tara:strand:+ start:252 stop:590 length:339 start_codon:yes stop_codon:yes gene_type:complete